MTVGSALAWLVWARLLHARHAAPALLARFETPPPVRPRPLSPAERERLSRALAGVARRVPFRADCLVQALAARLWLERRGVASALRLGARRVDDADGPIAAHAWLLAGGEPVTGGRLDAGVTPFEPVGAAQSMPGAFERAGSVER